MKRLIIFICNGNIHRSVIAAELLKKILKKNKISQNYLVDSYGIQGTRGTALPKFKQLSDYTKEYTAAEPTLRKLDIDISKHSFQKISLPIIKKASVVIAMDNKVYLTAKNSLRNQFPTYMKKIHPFSELTAANEFIEDPAGSGRARLHKKIIEDIYFTLSKKYQDILSWIE